SPLTMASFKELSLSRPLNPNQRSHAHSISLGAVNANHRVTRRKSVTTSAANAVAAIAASMKEDGESLSLPMAAHRRSLGGRKGLESASVGSPSGYASYLSRSVNSPSQEPVPRKSSPSNSEADSKSISKGRNRRASEGGQMKSDGKRNPADLRCDRCGKGYKHGSCLSKHMWEHDPAWNITSKLLISKHQQVQLLEAASVLVNMNIDEEPEESPEADSEISSGSPGALSEVRDGISSAETTPPPLDEEEDDDFEMSGMPANWTKRPSISNASAFSRSYQSIPSSSYNESAPLHSPAFSHFRKSSVDTRPSTADTRLHEDDEADLAAAIGLCNFGTPRTNPVANTPDVPPVPPLPARYLDSSSHQSPGLAQPSAMSEALRRESNASLFLSASLNPSQSYKVSDLRGARGGEDTAQATRQRRNADVDFGSRTSPTDDDDDGVFGRMEE
ncbi:DNA excision repair protein ERCC-6-like 2, partial [Penicillium atrosanguineum]